MILAKFFGTKSDREMKKLLPTLDKINQLYETFSSKTDEDLVTRTQELKEFVINQRLEKAQSLHADMDQQEREAEILKAEQGALDFIMVEAFAIVKETCRRICGSSWRVSGQETLWEMVPYDVQLLGAITLHSGKVSEMKTGEGKTLVATLPAYLNALSEKGVHVITVNEYLAKRDADWMRPIYEFLDLTVSVTASDQSHEEKKAAYSADITYTTNNELGFDYLRDNLAFSSEDKVQKELNFAIVDEVDSILIDEARTPLVISGAVEDKSNQYLAIDKLIKHLISLYLF